MFEEYFSSLWGMFVILLTVFVQSLVASIAHRRQSVYVPGVVDGGLGHESFVFRSRRTLMNSLENVVLVFGLALIGILFGVDALWLPVLVWIYALARIFHVVLYYAIATEANPSPRSYFFVLGLASNLGLFILLALHLSGAT